MIREFQYRDLKTGETFSIEVEIDVESISRKLAARILKSKHGKATIVGGMIKAKRIQWKP